MTDPRTRTSIPVEFRAGAVHGRGKVRNVSEGGLFVGTTSIPEQGEEVNVQLAAPGEAPIVVSGLVWWTTAGSAGAHRRPGFGLRLIEENERFLALVQRLS